MRARDLPTRATAVAILMVLLAFGGRPAVAGDDQILRACTRPGAGFFTRDSNGTPVGLEYDVLQSFATSLKRKLVIEDAPSFEELLARAESGRCDVAAAEITVTEDRKRRFAFSAPYFPDRMLVVQKAPTAFSRVEDLTGKRLAVVGGTLQAALVSALKEVTPVLVDDDDALFAAVTNGRAEALVCDSAVVLHHLTQHPDFSPALPLGERSFFAFALPKGSSLLALLNGHLRTLQENGQFQKLLGRHFGEANAEFLAAEVRGKE
ncbi:MAG: transporter substrate-binding domain-containing protein [Vicinamibacteria bacterium]